MNKHALKSGTIIGVITIVLTLIMYLIDPTLLASLSIVFISLGVVLILICYFGIQYRKEEGIFMSFGSAFGYSMQAFIVAGLLGTIFRMLLFNVIDTELIIIVTDAMVANQEAMMSKFGMPEDQMEEALDKARLETIDSFGVVGNLKSFAFGLIFYAILSLITGAIIKKKEPELEG